MNTDPNQTPTVALNLLDHDFDSEDELALPAPVAPSVASSVTPPVTPPGAPPGALEVGSITTPAGRRTAIALAIAASLLFVALVALLVVPTGIGRSGSNLAAFGSPTVPATDASTSSTARPSSTTSTPDNTVAVPTTPPRSIDTPNTVTTIRRPPTTTNATLPPTSSTSSSSTSTTSTTTPTTTPKPPADITTFTGSKVGICMVASTKLQVVITYATTDASAVALSVDGGPKTSLGATSGSTSAPFACSAASHTYTLFAHGPGGDMKQAIVVS